MNNTDLSNFKDYLVKKGYSKNAIPNYICRVSKFLDCKELISVQKINHDELKEVISKYIADIPLLIQKRRIQAALHTYYRFISGDHFLTRLNSKDFAIDLSIEVEIDRFRKFLCEVAGLRDNTIITYCNTVKTFLYSSSSGKNFSPGKITANHVRTYLVHTLQHVSAASKKTIIVRIRSYIRFLEFADGFQSEEILKLPMTSPVWKRAGIPKYLTYSESDRLFCTYNQANPVGIRDYAIARCLKDLGLRCSEVARLSLNDIDWIQGIVSIKKTKSHSERILPLHAITGQAIERYLLYSRPVTRERILFVRFKNVLGYQMGTSQVRETVRGAAVRAGLEHFKGTHMLRHTAAKEMINNGIDLKTIADVLGHESIETTRIYTKLDYTQLQDVAGTWPEVRV